MTANLTHRTTVADFIADRLAECDKTQREIAEECGFECQSARNFDHLSALNFDQVSGGYCGA